MLEKLLCAVLGLILGQGVCHPAGASHLTGRERAAIADTVEQVVVDWFHAFVELDRDGYAATLSEDLVVVGDGGYLSTDHDGPVWTGSFEAFREANGTIEIENIEVLGRDAAVLNWRVDMRWVMKDARVVNHKGLTTAVIARRGDKWKIIRQHHSGVRPGPS